MLFLFIFEESCWWKISTMVLKWFFISKCKKEFFWTGCLRCTLQPLQPRYIYTFWIYIFLSQKILRMTYNVQPYYRLYFYHIGLAVKCKMMYKLPCTVLYCQSENVILTRHISHRKFWGRIIIHNWTKGYLSITSDQW